MAFSWIEIVYLIFSVLTIYFGFLFILLYISNKGKLSAVPHMQNLPSVSILIPAHNEADVIAKAVRNAKELSYSGHGWTKKLKKGDTGKVEVIVVDDGSTDETAVIARALGVQVISKKQGGKASALNAGLAVANGAVVACIDSDSFPEKEALLKSVPFFKDSDVGAVTSRIYASNLSSFFAKLQNIEYGMIAWSRKLFEYIDSIYVTPGPLSFYRTDIIRKSGGFDEKNLTEDIE